MLTPLAPWMMRTTTNSAGAARATPTLVTTMPASGTSGGLVSLSHLTKNASSGVRPLRAPRWNSAVQVGGQLAHDAHPQPDVVGLVGEAGHEALKPAAHGQEDPPRARRAASRVVAQRARPPDPDAAAGHRAQAVHRLGRRVAPIVVVGQVDPQVKYPFDHLVGRGLVDADLLVAAGIDARHVPAGRHVQRRPVRHQAPTARGGRARRPAAGQRGPLLLDDARVAGQHGVQDGEPAAACAGSRRAPRLAGR